MTANLGRLQSTFVGFALLAPVSVLGAPASAQDQASNAQTPDQTIIQPEGLEQLGRTSDTGAGEIGQRQTVEDAPFNTEPLARINNRIQNRVENRLDRRIDRDYDPEDRATSAFEGAGARVRQVTRTGPR